ncbi:MFS transporter [Acaryochloris marina]|uniref:PNPLA domain-containing protein n=1 Tax=Acaryochloris marina (strain MBIC 11017) TaxID=329726 RepID=A8ZP36_ACAM1|nr:hypothetical protein [Acaryochloris marina]ABW32772.1 hypothetical protein AM1_E0002 [Acaryochloris marina MBIC11017]
MRYARYFVLVGLALIALFFYVKATSRNKGWPWDKKTDVTRNERCISKLWFYIVSLRVPIISILVILSLPIISATVAKRFLGNLYSLEYSWQISVVIFASGMMSLIAITTLETIAENIELRLELPLGERHNFFTKGRFSRGAFTLILASPTVAILFYKSLDIGVYQVVTGIIFGGLASIVFLYSIHSFHNWAKTRHRKLFEGFFKFILTGNINSCNNHKSLNGYFHSNSPASRTILNEHIWNLLLFVSGLFFYSITAFIFYPGNNILGLDDPPALWFAYLIIWMLTGILGGITFLADRFRIPVLLALFIFTGLSYLAFDVDHFYSLEPITKNSVMYTADNSRQTDDFISIINNKFSKSSLDKEKRTLVIVGASGGGIQASGWTVEALEGLNQDLGKEFTNSIGLISSTSGGSVGTMYFLDGLKDGSLPETSSSNLIFEKATSNSLDAIGWGLSYPDFLRIISLPPLAGDDLKDRGYAVEDDWKNLMQNPDTKLSDWKRSIDKGEIPIPVFNATLIEDGRRFLISPVSLIDGNLQDLVCNQNSNQLDRKALDFRTLFPNKDLFVTTAARLSATFPYVSPIPRNQEAQHLECPGSSTESHDFVYHVADGGFFDNSGLFTAIEWVDNLLKNPVSELEVERILLLEITAFPGEKLKGQKGNSGWLNEWVGPLLTLNSVRDSTQKARDQKEIEGFADLWRSKGIKVEHFSIPYNSNNQPLSWKLSLNEKDNIRDEWNSYKRSSEYRCLNKYWTETDKWDSKENCLANEEKLT